MNEIINRFLLAGDIRQPGITYSACWPFTKNVERIKTFKETGGSRYIYLSKRIR